MPLRPGGATGPKASDCAKKGGTGLQPAYFTGLKPVQRLTHGWMSH